MCFDIKKSFNKKGNGPSRPYSDYDIFFELEREFVLQKIFHVDPSLKLPETFDQESAEYKGPPLPSRYSGLILHREWHMRGKDNRTKHFDRDTHGKIGSEELSRMISSVWESTDHETKQFCKAFSEKSKLQYKAALFTGARSEHLSRHIRLKSRPSQSKPLSPFSSSSDKSMDLDNAVTSPTAPSTHASINATDSSDCLEESVIDNLFAHLSSLEHQNGREDLVDIQDDEITELWNFYHGANHLPSICIPIAETKRMNENEDKTKLVAAARGNIPHGLFKKDPMQRIFIAKSA